MEDCGLGSIARGRPRLLALASAPAALLAPGGVSRGPVLFFLVVAVPLGLLLQLLLLILIQERLRHGQVPGLEGGESGLGWPLGTDGPLALVPLDLLVRPVEARGGDDLDVDVELFLERRELPAEVVLEGVGELRVEADPRSLDRSGRGPRLDAAEDREAHHLLAREPAHAVAGGAGAVSAELERLLDPLPVDLDQAVRADPPHGRARLVRLHRVLQGLLDLPLVLGGPHVDEVHHHDAADVAQAELAGDLGRRLAVGVDRRLLLGGGTGRAAGVDVDRGQRLGRVDHDRATARKLHPPLVDAVDLLLQAIAGEERQAVGVVDQAGLRPRHERLHVGLGLVEGVRVVDQHLLHAAVEIIPQRLKDQVLVGVEEPGPLAVDGRGLDPLPQPEQGQQIPVERRLGLFEGVGADDDAASRRQVESRGDHLELLPGVLVLDLPGDPPRVLEGGEHQVAPGEREGGGERRPLGADRVLGDLDHDRLALLEHVLDARRAAPGVAVVRLGDHVLDGQEAVALGPIVDEGRVQAGLDAGDHAAVDVAAGEAGFSDVDFVILQGVALDDGDAQLFRTLRVDQHSAAQVVSVVSSWREGVGAVGAGDRIFSRDHILTHPRKGCNPPAQNGGKAAQRFGGRACGERAARRSGRVFSKTYFPASYSRFAPA
jgi:hypothetical protein